MRFYQRWVQVIVTKGFRGSQRHRYRLAQRAAGRRIPVGTKYVGNLARLRATDITSCVGRTLGMCCFLELQFAEIVYTLAVYEAQRIRVA